MILYLIYRKYEIAIAKEMKLPEQTTVDIVMKQKQDSSVEAIEVIIKTNIEEIELSNGNNNNDNDKHNHKTLEVSHQITDHLNHV